MKLLPKKNFRQREDGMATILFITLLTIMVLLAIANGMALIRLHREVKFVEQQQIKRLNGPQNHSVPAVPAITNSNSK
jgi:hypothetical protein